MADFTTGENKPDGLDAVARETYLVILAACHDAAGHRRLQQVTFEKLGCSDDVLKLMGTFASLSLDDPLWDAVYAGASHAAWWCVENNQTAFAALVALGCQNSPNHLAGLIWTQLLCEWQKRKVG